MSLCLLLICVPILSYVFVAIEVAEITEGFSIHPKEGELIMPLNISTMDLKEIILHVIKTFSLNIAITFLGGYYDLIRMPSSQRPELKIF